VPTGLVRCLTSDGPGDDRFAYLSDVLPTVWQGVEYAAVPEGGTLVVLGLGPVGDFACRIGQHKGYRVIGVDLVPDRLQRLRDRGVEVIDLNQHEQDLAEVIRGMTDDRGPDSVLGAVGLEAHGSPVTTFVQKAAGLLPSAVAAPLQEKVGVDRLNAVLRHRHRPTRWDDLAVRRVRRAADPMPMLTLFDKQIQLRMGQCNVKRWVEDIRPLLPDADPLGVDTFAAYRIGLDEAPAAYRAFDLKRDGHDRCCSSPARVLSWQ